MERVVVLGSGDEEFDEDDEATGGKVVGSDGEDIEGGWRLARGGRTGLGRVITKYKGWAGPRHRARQAD